MDQLARGFGYTMGIAVCLLPTLIALCYRLRSWGLVLCWNLAIIWIVPALGWWGLLPGGLGGGSAASGAGLLAESVWVVLKGQRVRRQRKASVDVNTSVFD
jgi:hypothetical protein